MGHQARQALQGDVPNARPKTLNVFLCRRQRAGGQALISVLGDVDDRGMRVAHEVHNPWSAPAPRQTLAPNVRAHHTRGASAAQGGPISAAQTTQLAAEISRKAPEQILRIDAQLLQQTRMSLRVHLVRQFGLGLSGLVVLAA